MMQKRGLHLSWRSKAQSQSCPVINLAEFGFKKQSKTETKLFTGLAEWYHVMLRVN